MGTDPKTSEVQDTDDTDEQDDTEVQDAADTFDKERALATIRKLREAERAGKLSAKENQQLKDKLQEIEDAKLGEQDRANKRAEAAERKAQAAEDRAKALLLQTHVERGARKLNIVDEDAAYRLLDLSKVEYDDDEPTNVEALLKDLVKAKPYLVAGEAGNGAEKVAVSATPKSKGGTPTTEQVINTTKDEMRRSGRYSL